MVSCGFLRLLNPSFLDFSLKEPLKRIRMTEPKKGPPATQGQYEMDLAVYVDPPDIYDADYDTIGSIKCMKLHSNGHKPRERYVGYFSSNELLQEELCGPASKILHLYNAILFQVLRFNANRALSSEWNFGTHPAETAQYSLGKGVETRNLMYILQEQVISK